jgi:microcystin-dependent protein
MTLTLQKLIILNKLMPLKIPNIKLYTQTKIEEVVKTLNSKIAYLHSTFGFFLTKQKEEPHNNIGLPVGTIVQYAGTIPPTGWLICNGSSLLIVNYSNLYDVINTIYGSDNSGLTFNLPDFRGRTSIGTNSNNNALSNRFIGTYEGNETQSLTIDQLPPHNHNAFSDQSGNHNHSGTTSIIPNHIHNTNSSGDQYNQYGMMHKSYGGNNTANNLELTETFNSPDILTQPLQLDIYAAGTHNHEIIDDGLHNHNISINNTGNGQSFNIMPPFLVINYIIKH